jgi:hypothetical protein
MLRELKLKRFGTLKRWHQHIRFCNMRKIQNASEERERVNQQHITEESDIEIINKIR